MSKYAIRQAKSYLSKGGEDSICDVFFQAMGIKSLLLEKAFINAGANDTYAAWVHSYWDRTTRFLYRSICVKYRGCPTFRKYKKEQMRRLKALEKQLV
jgi:hypothetical protein